MDPVARVPPAWGDRPTFNNARKAIMLILTRRADESLRISDDIVVTVLKVTGNHVRIGTDAARNVPVVHEEILDRPLDEESRPEYL